jgi:hypothetical protein
MEYLRLLLLLGVLSFVHGNTGVDKITGGSRCEEITIPMCRGIGYNLTSMPNELNHDTQEEAGLEVRKTILIKLFI